MNRYLERLPLRGLAVPLAAGVAALGASYGLVGYTRAFLFLAVDEAVVAATPGPIVTWSIETLGESGHLLHQALSLTLVLGGVAVVAAGARVAAREAGTPLFAPVLAAVGVWAMATALLRAPVAAAAPAVGAAVPLAVAGVVDVSGDTDAARRSTLGAVGAAVGTLVVGGVAGGRIEQVEPDRLDEAAYEEYSTIADRARASAFELSGAEPLLSEQFYTVDTASTPPRIDKDEWTVSVTGAVEEEVELTFEDIESMETVTEPQTLRCVGERLNGKKMDTAVWTASPIEPILEMADVDSGCGCVMLRSTDGFYEEFPLEALRDGLLAYGMNGEELPPAHGYPVRALVPGHWGEVNVKWLDEIEILNEEAKGYWEKRGWQGTGPVNTVAKLHHTPDGDGYVGGHAYAGTRGISGVEVSIDGGDTWNEAELTDPLPGDDVWRQWRYELPGSGTYEVVVRAIDDNGDVQTQEQSSPAPSGATGWVSQTVEV
jgi:DMSO/TMAO reductase YedYZ molybdopterin-dependent catalytic subunit